MCRVIKRLREPICFGNMTRTFFDYVISRFLSEILAVETVSQKRVLSKYCDYNTKTWKLRANVCV